MTSDKRSRTRRLAARRLPRWEPERLDGDTWILVLEGGKLRIRDVGERASTASTRQRPSGESTRRRDGTEDAEAG